jgi:hypothetical protein
VDWAPRFCNRKTLTPRRIRAWWVRIDPRAPADVLVGCAVLFDRWSTECLAVCFLPFVRVARFPSMRLGTPCWMWEGARNERGYGVMVLPDGPMTASRFALEWVLRTSLGDDYALHRCDEAPCVNPLHLYVGTHSDNARDLSARGSNSRTSYAPFTGHRIIRVYKRPDPWSRELPRVKQ